MLLKEDVVLTTAVQRVKAVLGSVEAHLKSVLQIIQANTICFSAVYLLFFPLSVCYLVFDLVANNWGAAYVTVLPLYVD